MPYVHRDETGKITKVSNRMLIGSETLPHSDPEIRTFLVTRGQDPLQVANAVERLNQSDTEMARTVEDLILVMLKKNLLKMSELPKIVQDRLATRVKLRALIEDIYEQASGTKEM